MNPCTPLCVGLWFGISFLNGIPNHRPAQKINIKNVTWNIQKTDTNITKVLDGQKAPLNIVKHYGGMVLVIVLVISVNYGRSENWEIERRLCINEEPFSLLSNAISSNVKQWKIHGQIISDF